MQVDSFIFMKVGPHARETLEDTVARKREEIRNGGYSIWGYGGSACHPTKQTQPFIQEYGSPVLLMNPVLPTSRESFDIPDKISTQYSIDGVVWQDLPSHVKVTGSKWAFWISEYKDTNDSIDLADFSVAAGPSKGRSGSHYIYSRSDKGVFTRHQGSKEDRLPKVVKIRYQCTLVPPYCTFVR